MSFKQFVDPDQFAGWRLSHAIRVDNIAYLGGQAPLDKDNELAAPAPLAPPSALTSR